MGTYLYYLVGLLIPQAYAGGLDDIELRSFCEVIYPSSACASGSGLRGDSFLSTFFDRVGDLFAATVAGLAVVAIIYGSIKLVTSAGNDQGKEEAKKIIMAAIVGLILALAVEGIFTFVRNFVIIAGG
ncbi:pilin [Patescibacteria group bacterium]|nr:pilin [Patescibacteria group bacterium]MBU1911142.1 pilin [Patescibacteria group bacterium]